MRFIGDPQGPFRETSVSKARDAFNLVGQFTYGCFRGNGAKGGECRGYKSLKGPDTYNIVYTWAPKHMCLKRLGSKFQVSRTWAFWERGYTGP